jgi:hypothetical protein
MDSHNSCSGSFNWTSNDTLATRVLSVDIIADTNDGFLINLISSVILSLSLVDISSIHEITVHVLRFYSGILIARLLKVCTILLFVRVSLSWRMKIVLIFLLIQHRHHFFLMGDFLLLFLVRFSNVYLFDTRSMHFGAGSFLFSFSSEFNCSA